MANWIKRISILALVLLIGGAIYLAMRPKPISVDVAKVSGGPMQVSIDAEGITRVRDIYTVSAPIAGHLARSKLEEGEAVLAGNTVIASIHPLDPPLIDERTRAELEAARDAALSAISLAEVDRSKAQMAFDLAKSDYERASKLAKTNIVSEAKLERSYSEMQLQKAQVESNEALIQMRRAELVRSEARLRQPENINVSPEEKGCCVEMVSPIDGVVLKILARSEQAVLQGTPIAEIGDPRQMEIAVDVLSSDAPKLTLDTMVEISEWGGDKNFQARIRRIDPAAFTKISSLGIEEQRVNVIMDIEIVPEQLGNNYHVLARLPVWSTGEALQVPISALFRSDGEWAVFTIQEGRAVLEKLAIGHMSDETAEVLSGLSDGQEVILYPNDLLEDGGLVELRT